MSPSSTRRSAAWLGLSLFLFATAGPAKLFALQTGERAPSFALKNLDGKRVTLENLLSGGKPLLVAFFATWCEPCRKELPSLVALSTASKVSVILISLDEDASSQIVQKWLDKNGGEGLPVLLDPQQIAGGYFGVVSEAGRADMPHVFLIGNEGMLLWDHKGLDDDLVADVSRAAQGYKQTAAHAEQAPPGAVWVAFTNNANGWVLPANSTEHPMGSLSRRLSYLTQLKAQVAPLLIFDTGDNLPSDNSDMERCRAAAKAMTLIPYAAMVPGDQDLGLGGAFAMDNVLLAGRPFLTSNLAICRDETECMIPYAGHKIFDLNGVKVGVIGLFNPQAIAFYPDDVKKQIKVFSWEKKLRHELNLVRPKADIVILLSHSGFSNDKKIAERFSSIDIIVSGHTQDLLTEPARIGKTQIVEAGQDAAYVGKMLVSKTNDGAVITRYELVPMDQDIPDDSRIMALSSGTQ